MRKNTTTTPVVDFAGPVADLGDLFDDELDQDGRPVPQGELADDLGLHLTIGLREGHTAATRTAVLRIVGAWIARNPSLSAAEIFEGEDPYDDPDHYGADPTSFIGVRGATDPLPHEQELIGRLSGELVAALTAAGIAVQPCDREMGTAGGGDAGPWYPDGVAWFSRPWPVGPLIPALDVWGEEAAE